MSGPGPPPRGSSASKPIAVIWAMSLARQGEFGLQRRARVVKMHGTRHETDYHALVFDNGFKVTRILA